MNNLNKLNNQYKPLAITSGEPAGIGMDICLDLINMDLMDLPCPVVILGDKDLLLERAQLLNKNLIPNQNLHIFNDLSELINFDFNNHHKILYLLNIPLKQKCVVGQLNPNNSPYVIELLDTALNGINQNIFSGMVTAPIHKGVINQYFNQEKIHYFFSGHTEYLAEQSNTPQVVMMLVGGGMRVALLTTHLPLNQVSSAITPDLIMSVSRILHHDLITKFKIKNPKILLAGLNPHAGENGYLGREELDIMIPSVEKLRLEGIEITNPLPADTLFQPFYLDNADAVLAAYHDQGLPVLKYASFGGGVNVTLGLPFVRTSVDHGTALDLAGTGKAHSGSLKAAILTAFEMIQTD